MSHCKTFTIRLLISRLGDPSNVIEYYGTGQALKAAKNDAASKAFQDNILQKLIDQQNNVQGGPNYAYDSKSNQNLTRSVDELSARVNSLQFLEDKPDKFYDTWFFAKKHRLPISIDFDKIRRGITHTYVHIKFKLGDEVLKGNFFNWLSFFCVFIKKKFYFELLLFQAKEVMILKLLIMLFKILI